MNKPTFPQILRDLQTELLLHSKDGRSDAGFRLNIALSQVGNLAAHFTHDPKENPVARPYGSKESEMSDAGHAMVQLMTYCALRGIDLEKAVNTALVNLREKDFIKRSAKNSDGDFIIGQTGMTGIVRGKAFVDKYCSQINDITEKNLILVTNHPYSDARLKKFVGIVTDNGGTNCHAAIVARECGIPCVVGTGDATERIKSGDIIEINASVEQGQIRVI